jgi:protein-disulfide isomerase
MHPNARPAAEASLCAEEQGKFWPYHDLLFASSDKLTAPTLRGVAEKAGLDLAKYDACVKERRHRARVDADVADGRAARVSGTPAFFVNGIPLSGARSVEDFVQIIDRELARAAKEAS